VQIIMGIKGKQKVKRTMGASSDQKPEKPWPNPDTRNRKFYCRQGFI
jgi:hypothetical protein